MSTQVGACILGCSGPVLTLSEKAFFREAKPFGFILFTRNVVDHEQLRGLTADLRMTVGRNAPILIDQEGGRVQRLGPPLWRKWPSAAEEIAGIRKSHRARAMLLRARLIASELSYVGIDVNCLPVADIARPETHKILADRCYGDEPYAVASIARATARGLMDGGVLPVLKHIPGHGRATVDSHLDLPRVTASWTALQASDFEPFQALSDLPFGMTAHVVFEAIDEDAPVTTSPAAISFIRDDIGFGGFLMTDDISMKALSGDLADRCRASLRAGCDGVLHCNGKLAEMEQVVAASGALTGNAAARANRALARRRPAAAADLAKLEAELESLRPQPRPANA